MRKKSSRTPRMVAKPLTPTQHGSLVIGPRMHLQMLLAGTFDLAYICSVAGLFNIAGILAHFKNCTELQTEIDQAQEVILDLIRELRVPDPIESLLLQKAVNLADQWIAIQDTATLAKAVNFSYRESAKIRQQQRQQECTPAIISSSAVPIAIVKID